MKKTLTLFAAVLMTAVISAQAPDKMSYQAIIRDTEGNLITEQEVGMQISILQESTFGASVYIETQTPITNANGLVTIAIGDGVVVHGPFSDIDWADGPYFIKTETDPSGGTDYTISGISQLLSVPYALHAKTAETISEPIVESDPLFETSPAADIEAADIGNWDESYSWGDHAEEGYLTEESDPLFTDWDKSTGITITESQISDLGNYIETETDPGVPTGTQAGEMQYWDGSEWLTVPAGNEGQFLSFSNGEPVWLTLVEVKTVGPTDVYNPTTGEIWMDRNLGASQVATSSTDANAYGDLYQWGRATDGHEIRTSGTTSELSSSDTPGHGDFILAPDSPYDWRSTQNDNLWQGVSGINNPCPSGYRLPNEAEWEAERTSWGSNNTAGAFASPLKLPVAGNRSLSDGSLSNVGSRGLYWSSTVFSTYSRLLDFQSNSASRNSLDRAYGFSVRCIKD